MSKGTESVVLEVLEEVLKRPSSSIRAEQELVRDLGMDGDDYSFLFVPRLEQRLGVRPDLRDWNSVRTVADVVLILDRAIQTRVGG